MSLILLGLVSSQAAAAGAAGAYDLLETQTLGTAAASVTFTGLGSYSAYKHLQIRLVARSTTATFAADSLRVQFNSDTGSNYAQHRLLGNGSNVASSASTSASNLRAPLITGPLGTTNAFGAGVIDILDFSSNSKNSTIRGLSGVNATAGANFIDLFSGVWLDTDAITSVYIFAGGGGNLVADSRFSLYGIKAGA